MNEASPSNMIRSYMDACLSDLPNKSRCPGSNTDYTYLSDVSGRSVLPDEMQQIVFTIVQDDRTLLRLGVDEASGITSECATGFKSKNESLSVGVFHRTEWVNSEALLVLRLVR